MTCVAGTRNFRLLDNNVGWDYDPAATVNLTGFDSPDGICLTQSDPGALDPNDIFPYLPPPRLARGCAACEWYLITPAPPQSLLLHRDACHTRWLPVWSHPCAPEPFKDAVAVSSWQRWIAVSDKDANQVLVWSQKGARLVGEIPVAAPGPIAFSPHGELLVTSANSPAIARYSLGGDLLGYLKAQLPQQQGTLYSIAVDSHAGVWVVFQQGTSFTLWLAKRTDTTFHQQTSVDDLRKAFAPSGVATAAPAGFCFDEDSKRGLDATTCFNWYGRPAKPGDIVPLLPPQRQRQGQLITFELDSGVPRCEWHRIRLDADLPKGTALIVSVATTEDPHAPNLGDSSRDVGWTTFPPGPPHFSDWTSGPAGSRDFLIVQPPGRYLFFRLRMRGDGINTPVVRRVRIDFPRLTSLDRLPDIYRETPKAEDFTKRFLSLFDASIADMDAMIERYPSLLSPAGLPDQILPWLGGFFAVGFDSTWNADKRRAILQAVPQLYRHRGTAAALQLAVQTIFGVTPVVRELSSVGPWGSIADRMTLNIERRNPTGSQLATQRNVQLGASRLFGKNSTRFRLNRSALGSAPVRSFGNPDLDPFSSGSFRLEILVPPLSDMSKEQRERLNNLINAQIPAHTVASIRIGGSGFFLGTQSAIGVDTGFLPATPPVLGSAGNIRLSRMSVLWNGPRGAQPGAIVGRNFVVGRQIIAG